MEDGYEGSKAWKLLGLIFIMVFVLSAANVVHAVGVTATITVGTSPTGVAYDSGQRRDIRG